MESMSQFFFCVCKIDKSPHLKKRNRVLPLLPTQRKRGLTTIVTRSLDIAVRRIVIIQPKFPKSIFPAIFTLNLQLSFCIQTNSMHWYGFLSCPTWNSCIDRGISVDVNAQSPVSAARRVSNQRICFVGRQQFQKRIVFCLLLTCHIERFWFNGIRMLLTNGPLTANCFCSLIMSNYHRSMIKIREALGWSAFLCRFIHVVFYVVFGMWLYIPNNLSSFRIFLMG